MLAIRLPKEIENRLGHLASMTGRTKSYYARKAILDLIEDMEDTFLAIEALTNPGKSIPHEEVIAEIEALDKERVANELAN